VRILRPAVVAACVFAFAAQAFASYRITAWIPPWDQNALTSIQKNGGAVSESNPVWYSWNADGTIAKNWNAENNTWRAAMTGSALIPTIQNVVSKSFSASAVETMLATPASREAHAAAIFQLVSSNAFDGIDVDYERVPASSRANFTAFINTLGAKLHGSGKKLSVTVYAKTGDVTWNGAGAEDWAAIGSVADSVKLMAYDYHYASTPAGAITPLDWLDQVVTYAESVIPRAKIIVGLPWYGYDWSSSGGATASYASATLVAQNNGVTIGRDASGEATYTYSGHTVFFQDATSYQKKIDLIKQKHGSVGGFAHWAAGVEDPAIWSVIRGTSVPAPTPSPTPAPAPQPAPAPSPAQPLPADFSVSGPSVVTLTQGSELTADYRLTAINGFSSTANLTIIPLTNYNGVVAAATPAIAPSSPMMLRVAATSLTAPGTYQVALRFTSGTLVHDTVLTIVVNVASRHRAAGR
jgi:spore germination protein